MGKLQEYFTNQAQALNSIPWTKRKIDAQGYGALGRNFKKWIRLGATTEEIHEIIDTFMREMRHTPSKQPLWKEFVSRQDYWSRNIGKKKAPGDGATQEELEAYWLGNNAESIRRGNARKLGTDNRESTT